MISTMIFAKMNTRLYLHNALAYSDPTWCVLWQPWPEVTCTVSAQCHPVVRRYEKKALVAFLNGLAKNSLDSVKHVESNNTQFPISAILGVGHFVMHLSPLMLSDSKIFISVQMDDGDQKCYSLCQQNPLSEPDRTGLILPSEPHRNYHLTWTEHNTHQQTHADIYIYIYISVCVLYDNVTSVTDFCFLNDIIWH